MKCTGQTRGLPLLDDHGKPVRCSRWLEILRAEDRAREAEFRRSGGFASVMAIACALGCPPPGSFR